MQRLFGELRHEEELPHEEEVHMVEEEEPVIVYTVIQDYKMKVMPAGLYSGDSGCV